MGVDILEGVLLHTKVNVLISDVGFHLLDFKIQPFNFFMFMDDFEMDVKCKAASWSSPLAVADVLSCIAQEIEV